MIRTDSFYCAPINTSTFPLTSWRILIDMGTHSVDVTLSH